jgi:hypothetical protein
LYTCGLFAGERNSEFHYLTLPPVNDRPSKTPRTVTFGLDDPDAFECRIVTRYFPSWSATTPFVSTRYRLLINDGLTCVTNFIDLPDSGW